MPPYPGAIVRTKKAKTRIKRIATACDMLAAGKRLACCVDRSGMHSTIACCADAKSGLKR
ncbi:hypothetical protein XaplCFBP3123_20745 [Xanthomonas arboricola pv. populi]|nr:hypothetical protein XaplCFBP3123_20745 [Xanthomonas arboricola pv. populi]